MGFKGVEIGYDRVDNVRRYAVGTDVSRYDINNGNV